MKRTKEDVLQSTPVVCILAILCCTLWGSAFPGIKLGYQYFAIATKDVATQILFAGCRFALAGLLTIIFGSLLQYKILLPKRDSFKRIIPLSTFQTVLQYLFFYIGLANTNGVKASIINGSSVFVAIFFACVVFRQEKLTTRKVIGCSLGFFGVVLINLNGSSIDFSFHLLGEGFIILTTVAYSISSTLMKNYSTKDNPVMLSGYQFFLGGLIMCICGLVAGGRIQQITTKGILMLCYLAFLSAVAYTIWGILLKYNPVSKVSIYGFMNPVSGVILSSLLLHEKNQEFGWNAVLALVLVCVGIYVVNFSKTGLKKVAFKNKLESDI